jgi:hypothetical protein
MVKSIDPFDDDNESKDEPEIRLLNEDAMEGIRWEHSSLQDKDNEKE